MTACWSMSRAAGTLIVQYNKFEFNDAQYGPRQANVSRNRVTDENASVRVLAHDHPIFAWPNRLNALTWSNWVQERGLYFLGEKDPAYVDLVELEDTFEWNPGVKRVRSSRSSTGRGAGCTSVLVSGGSFRPGQLVPTSC